MKKQETLEEAAARYFKKVSPNVCFYDAVKFGAKWQEQRMYSEKEVMNIIDSFIDNLQDYTPTFNSRQEWFEQFKKK